jgi:hypothetical protein
VKDVLVLIARFENECLRTVRFKKTLVIPFELIGELCEQMAPQRWMDIYEDSIKPS